MTSKGVGKGSTFFIELPSYMKLKDDRVMGGLYESVLDQSRFFAAGSRRILLRSNSRFSNFSRSTGRSHQSSGASSLYSVNQSVSGARGGGATSSGEDHSNLSELEQGLVLRVKPIGHYDSKVAPAPFIADTATSLSTPPEEGHALVHPSNSTTSLGSASGSSRPTKKEMLHNRMSFLAAPSKSYRILVVDDSVPNRKMLSRLLTREHHMVTEASDGNEAVQLVKRALDAHNHARTTTTPTVTATGTETVPAIERTPSSLVPPPLFDLILMDYYMPKMIGPDATSAIRKLGYTGKILGVSGAMDDDVHHFIESGADLVLCKPITLTALWKALRGTNFFDDDNNNAINLIDSDIGMLPYKSGSESALIANKVVAFAADIVEIAPDPNYTVSATPSMDAYHDPGPSVDPRSNATVAFND